MFTVAQMFFRISYSIAQVSN